MNTNEFSLIRFQDELIAKLVGLWKLGRRGRKVWSCHIEKARRQLKARGYSNSYEVVRDAEQMAALQLACEGTIE